MASETVKIIGGNGFNEGGGTVFSTVTGEATDLANPALSRTALPADYNMYGITGYVTISVGAETGEIVPAVPGRQIRVLSYVFVAFPAATTATFKSGTTAISGDIALEANGGISQTGESEGLMETAKGEALNITNTAGGIEGHLTYMIV